ncbi:uncharacterized protein LOC131673937 [Phymastichus coffea]|uniref:uncharacterized protein LOC131673937 n=1 Tax=Phymastichus coffea TaxID=108790 RepID=UPI00273A7959|nr:uncharacterized protein LOC131673937 [Phymastichus coffea]
MDNTFGHSGSFCENNMCIAGESQVFESKIDLLNIIEEVEIVTSETEFSNTETLEERNILTKQVDMNFDTGIKTQHPFNVRMENFKDNKKAINFYTDLENYDKFMFVYRTLGIAVNELNYIYYTKPKMSVVDQFLLTLMILKQNKTYYEVGLFFNVCVKQVANIFITWIKFMSLQWSEVSQWPSRELVDFFTPHDFRKKFRFTKGIVDGTEIQIQKPNVPTTQQCTFSTYKNKPTAKTIICASPGGL